MEAIDEILTDCSNILPGHGLRRTMKDVFSQLAEGVPEDAFPDMYGQGAYLNEFERQVAALFGKEKAVFMPSGTMAQSIALRIWCQRSSNFTVAMSPTAHLEFAEHLGYQFLHGIHRIQFGACAGRCFAAALR